jgi:hypothetical protein
MSIEQEFRSLQQQYADLLRRVQVTEDIEEIKQVTFRYCRAADKKQGHPEHFVKGIHECFTEDGIWDGGLMGSFQGLKGHSDLWDGEFHVNSTEMVTHLALNPIIKVDGDQATGGFHLLGQLIVGKEAMWTAGRYDNVYVRTPKGWRIKLMKYDPWMWSRHLEGWAKERFAASAESY